MAAGIPDTTTTAPPAPAVVVANPWATLWQTIVRYDSQKVTPWMALRNALGVAVPLAAGALFGALAGGLIMSTGALNVAFSDSDAPYTQRARRMLGASALVGCAVFAGALCGHGVVLAVLTAAMWAFAAGMLVALSSTAADLGTTSLVVLVVYSAFPMSFEKALGSGLLAFAGGLFQTLLAVAFWPLRRFAPERKALGELYRALAQAAAWPVRTTDAPPATAESTQAQNALATLDREHSVEAERCRLLLSQAERLRLSLMTLARLRKRIDREEPSNPAVSVLDRGFYLISRVLSSLGNALVAGEPARPLPEELQELEMLAEKLRAPEDGRPSPATAMIADARFQMDAIGGQLRSAVDLSAHASPSGAQAFVRHEARQPWSLRLGSIAATLRANLSLDSAACRHAVRLAACIAIGDGIAHWSRFRRPYWLPMTIAIVLKPDFSATFSRGVLRLIGTFVGLAVATGMFHVLPPSLTAQVALIAALMFLMRCFGPANYGILVIAVTGLVVLLIALTGVAPADVIAARGMNTVVGGAIALIAYWLWPTWERTLAPEAMAQMLDAHRAYFRAIRESYQNPDQPLERRLDRVRFAARRARSNFEASVDRISAEPGLSSETLHILSAMLASSHRLVHAFMSLESGLSTSRPVAARDEFRPFADHVELTLYYLAAALRGSPLAQDDLPDLREDHHRLEQSGDPVTERYALVNVETDRITNALNTLSEQVLQWKAVARF